MYEDYDNDLDNEDMLDEDAEDEDEYEDEISERAWPLSCLKSEEIWLIGK